MSPESLKEVENLNLIAASIKHVVNLNHSDGSAGYPNSLLSPRGYSRLFKSSWKTRLMLAWTPSRDASCLKIVMRRPGGEG
uniref:Uncharacterized protein n=1 Tax=Fagus sylvatica TaxID=28930 RepID=A0A2N9GZ63_FAGSY